MELGAHHVVVVPSQDGDAWGMGIGAMGLWRGGELMGGYGVDVGAI